MNNKKPDIGSAFLALTILLIVIISLTACGRRADPFLPSDVEEDSTEQKEKIIIKERTKPDDIEDKKRPADEGLTEVPDAPEGLTALYTGKVVILTWNEDIDQRLSHYNIYRSTGEGFKLIGDAFAPAFADGDIKKNTTYYYRVTAVGLSESDHSDETEIITGEKQ